MESIGRRERRAGRRWRGRAGLALALLVAFAACLSVGAAVAAGPLRPVAGFGTRGVVRAGPRYVVVYSVAFDSRGRILVGAEPVAAPEEGAAVFRFLPDGRPDRSFGRAGVVHLEGVSTDIGLAPDSSGGVYVLVATIEDEMLLSHLGPDGAPRRRFGTRGLVRMPMSSELTPELDLNHLVVGLPGGGLVVAGGGGTRTQRLLSRGPLELRRFSPDGHRVLAFGHDGVAFVDDPRLRHFVMTDLASTPAGGILLSGSISSSRRAVVVRLGPRGRLDPHFGHDGLAMPPIVGQSSARVVLPEADGSVLVGAAVARPNPGERGALMRRPLLLRLRKDGAVARRWADTPTTDYESGQEAATLNARLGSLAVVGGRAFLATADGEQGSGTVLVCPLRGHRARYLRLASRGFENVAGLASRGRELVVLATSTMDPTKGPRGFILRAFHVRQGADDARARPEPPDPQEWAVNSHVHAPVEPPRLPEQTGTDTG